MSHKDTAGFILTLLHSATVTHIQHFQAKGEGSYSRHKALRSYYDKVIDLIDTFTESYQGKYELIEEYPEEYDFTKDSLDYLEYMQDYVATKRKKLPQDSELQNIVDEIAHLINSTVYKLKYLK
jgi:hypothetical protein